MVDVMLKLQTKKFPSGESVKARLKSLVVSSVTPSPVPLPLAQQLHYDPEKVMKMYAPKLSNQKKQSYKARKNKGKNQQQSGNSNSSTGKKHNHQGIKSNAGQTARHSGNQDAMSCSVTKVLEVVQVPPKLGEDDFPSLPPLGETQTNKIEVEKVPDSGSDDDEFAKNRMGAGFSDSSSTATTSTSSTPSPSQPNFSTVMGGYAAALLKPAIPMQASTKSKPTDISRQSKTSTNSVGNANNVSKCGKKVNTKEKKKDEIRVAHPPVVVQPPSWGGGLSFADILRRKEKEVSADSA
jgi:hypothetical protein